MLPAFLTDNRIEYHQRRTIRAQDRRIEILEGQATLWKQLFESQRQRAERAEAELERIRTERDQEIAERFSRIEAALGLPMLLDFRAESDDATEN